MKAASEATGTINIGFNGKTRVCWKHHLQVMVLPLSTSFFFLPPSAWFSYHLVAFPLMYLTLLLLLPIYRYFLSLGRSLQLFHHDEVFDKISGLTAIPIIRRRIRFHYVFTFYIYIRTYLRYF